MLIDNPDCKLIDCGEKKPVIQAALEFSNDCYTYHHALGAVKRCVDMRFAQIITDISYQKIDRPFTYSFLRSFPEACCRYACCCTFWKK